MYGTAQDIIDLTGITPQALGFEENQTTQLNTLLNTWLTRISAHIDLRLGDGAILQTDSKYPALVDVCLRTTAKLVAIALQQRTSPIVQINDFAISVLNTSAVIQDLDNELKPFQRRRVNFFNSTRRK